MAKIKIARADEVKDGASVKFTLTGGPRPVECFLARFQGKLVAYENRCRHLPTSLDFHDGHFFSPDGQNFICHNHNAIYDPLTGRCTRGPCAGQSLKSVAIEEIDGEVWTAG